MSDFLVELGKWLIAEFVPKTDSQVQKLLKSREDIFIEYQGEAFERIHAKRYIICKSWQIRTSGSWLYLM
jgi:hypothetical protein